MGVRRMIAVLAVVTVLVAGTLKASPARADDAGETAMWVGIGVGAFVGLVVLGTILVYGPPETSSLTSEQIDLRYAEPEPGVRFGHGCRQGGPSFTLACW